MTKCRVEYTDRFDGEFQKLPIEVRKKAMVKIGLLEEEGVGLGEPHSSAIKNAEPSMRELKFSVGDHEWRILYKFDPRRNPALLLIGDKTGIEKNWYKTNVPIAGRVYLEYLDDLYKDFPDLREKAKTGKKKD